MESPSTPRPSRGKSVLVADDDASVRFVLERALTRSGFQVQGFSNGQDLLAEALSGAGDLVITDIIMPSLSGLDLLKTLRTSRPDLPVIVITAQSTLVNAVAALESGAFDYLPKPFDINHLIALADRAVQQSPPRPAPADSDMDPRRFGGIIGTSRPMQDLFRTIGRLANSEMTVLIQGESGVGKELVAQAIHAYSPRAKGPFTAINMAAIPRELIESELFGHEKGAFTGAVVRRPGHFEKTASGTLFLDEIGDMPLEAQTRLLRVLQDGSFTAVGGAEVKKSDVRVIAATHQDLHAAIQAGRFREDLFYRLNVIPISVPSLRARREDIPLLSTYFLTQTARELSLVPKTLSPETLSLLTDYHWPGNVRELENLMRRMTVLVPDNLIRPEHLADALRPDPQQQQRPVAIPVEQLPPAEEESLREAIVRMLDRFFETLNGLEPTGLHDLFLEQLERPLISRVLQETRGNQIKAARILGINRNTLRKKIRELEIQTKPGVQDAPARRRGEG